MSKISPLISIVIPIYNAEKFLDKCIESVQKQTYENLQIILVDDGSTDSSLEICYRFAEKDARVEVYHIENRGSVAARKEGLQKVRGEYVGFVDADDYIDLNMYEIMVVAILDRQVDFVHMGYVEESNGSRVICDFEESVVELKSIEDKILFLEKYVINQGKGTNISFSIWSKIYKRELIVSAFNKLSDYQQYGEDLLCLCECVLYSSCIYLCKRHLYHYRVLEQSLSHTKGSDYLFKEIGLCAELLKRMQGYQDIVGIRESISKFVGRHMVNALATCTIGEMSISRYYYDEIESLFGKRIVLYGAGNVGKDYYVQICKYKAGEIVAWVDSNWQKYRYDYADIIDFCKVKREYDIVLIAVKSKTIADEIKRRLIEQGVCREKIVWLQPGEYW